MNSQQSKSCHLFETQSSKQHGSLNAESSKNIERFCAACNLLERFAEAALSVLHAVSAYFFLMGLIGSALGRIAVETPKYEVIKSCAEYEIRKYVASVVAQITYSPSEFRGDKDGGFKALADYIGALGIPQNTKPEKIAMTAPVVTKSEGEKIAMTAPVITKREGEKIAMTAPVVTKEDGGAAKNLVTMQFLLPEKYKKAQDAPKPVDERVVIREEGERKYGVVKFSGVASEEVVREKAEKLKKCLERDGHEIIGEFLLARYNPPWTLPPLRTNEIMIPVE